MGLGVDPVGEALQASRDLTASAALRCDGLLWGTLGFGRLEKPPLQYSDRPTKKKDPAAISGSGAPHCVGKKRDRKEDLKDLGSRLPITSMAIS